MLVSDKEAHSNVGIVAKAASYQRTILTIWLSVYFILTSSYVKMPREVLGLSAAAAAAAAAAGSTVPVLSTEGALGATTATVLGGTLLELLESGQVLGTTRFLGGAEPTTGADLLAGAETGSAGRSVPRTNLPGGRSGSSSSGLGFLAFSAALAIASRPSRKHCVASQRVLGGETPCLSLKMHGKCSQVYTKHRA